MQKVIILGGSGNIARHVTDILLTDSKIDLTLFVRSKRRPGIKEIPRVDIVEGDVLNFIRLKAAITGQDVVYANLAGDLETMAKNIVQAMDETGVKRLIFISSIGIYDEPLKPVLKPYRKAADVIEASALDYTILRPAWFTNVDEVDFEITRKGELEKGSVISQKSLATFIVSLIALPGNYKRESLGINKPEL